MTVYWYDTTGRILQTAATMPPASAFDDRADVTRAETNETVSPMTHYVVDGAAVPMPAAPTIHHRFDWATKAWELNSDAAWSAVRTERDGRLTRCDWVVTRAQEEGTPVPPEWREYRQALRDITDQADPCAIEWPTPPA